MSDFNIILAVEMKKIIQNENQIYLIIYFLATPTMPKSAHISKQPNHKIINLKKHFFSSRLNAHFDIMKKQICKFRRPGFFHRFDIQNFCFSHHMDHSMSTTMRLSHRVPGFFPAASTSKTLLFSVEVFKSLVLNENSSVNYGV